MVGETGRRHYRLTFATLALGAGAYTLLQAMVLPALPAIQRDLHTTQASSAWVLTGYLLSASVATPILGRLGDMFGKKRMLVVVFAALSVGTLAAALSTSIGMLVAARVVQGTAGAMFPLAFGIIRDEFPAEKVAGAIGTLSASLGIGSGLGMVIGGPVAQHLSYHWLFWIPLVLAVAATVATALVVPESPVRAEGKVNVPAAVALSGWLVALLLGVSRGPESGWTSSTVVGLFALAVVLAAVWVRVELVSREPLVDMRMMRIPAVWWTNVAGLLLGVAMYSMFVVLPPFLQEPKSTGYGFGASVTRSGLYLLPSTVTMLIAGLLVGRVTRRFGSKWPFAAGSVLAALPIVMLSLAHDHPWQILLATTVNGFGLGLSFSAMSNLVVEAVPATQTGIATGMNANIRTIGGSIGSQAIASVLASGILVSSGEPSEHAYVVSLTIMASAQLLAAGAAVFVPSPGPRVHRRGRTVPSTAAVPVSGDLAVRAG